jgi:putative transposase
MSNKKQKEDNSIIIRTERQYKKLEKKLDELCWHSKNLYNLTNYYIRQAFILGQKNELELTEREKEIINKINIKIDIYNKTLNKKMRYVNKNNYCINNYPFLDYTIRNLKDEEFPEGEINPYKQLPSGVSQQIIKNLCENWKGYLAELRDWKKNPDKYTGKPKMPNYKEKKDGRHILYFASNAFNHKDNKIFLAKKVIGYEYKTGVKEKVQQVRILPKKDYYIIETVYKYNNKHEYVKKYNENKKQRYISIDIGVNNLLTVANNIGERPFIINGKPIKSINKYYNKLKAKAMSFVGGRGGKQKDKNVR